jgi:hypothetical protein
MTYHVIIQPQAEAEIEAAYLWKRDNASQAAARWFAGIVDIRIQPKDESRTFIREWVPGTPVANYLISAAIEGIKPERV